MLSQPFKFFPQLFVQKVLLGLTVLADDTVVAKVNQLILFKDSVLFADNKFLAGAALVGRVADLYFLLILQAVLL